MAEKNNVNAANNLGLGELSTIRNILMGQQMSEYEQRFGSLEEKLSFDSQKQGENLEDFQSETRERFTAFEQQINARLDMIEQTLKDGLDRLQNQVADDRRNDNEALGQMLTEIGKKLMK